MGIRDVEEFIKQHLSQENSNKLDKSFEELTLQETFCLDLKYICKAITQSIDSSYYLISSFTEKYDLIFNKNTNWFYVNNQTIGNGNFISANKLFQNAPCSLAKCHRCAYIFALNYEGNVELKAGMTNPFNSNNSFLHSVCEIKLDNEKYIFDGANFLVMSKELYYKIFHFQELTSITKKDLVDDYIELSLDNGKNKNIRNLTKTQNFYSLKNVFNKSLKNKFKGLSFCTYLYDRVGFMENYNKTIKIRDKDIANEENLNGAENLNN